MCANCDELAAMTGLGNAEFDVPVVKLLDPRELKLDAAAALTEVKRDSLSLSEQIQLAIIANAILANDTLANLCLRGGDVDAAIAHLTQVRNLIYMVRTFFIKS